MENTDKNREKWLAPEDVAYCQKFDFELFVDEWKSRHNFESGEQWEAILGLMYSCEWAFFRAEILAYCLTRSDLYRVNEETEEICITE